MASELANTFPQLERYSHEISSTEKFNKLRSLPFFREFRDAELWEVLRGAVWETHGRDENLLLEGEIGQAFFIIVGGQVKVVKDGKLLNVLKEGDCFGEMAYLSGDRARRSASIISVSEVQLLKIQATPARVALRGLPAALQPRVPAHADRAAHVDLVGPRAVPALATFEARLPSSARTVRWLRDAGSIDRA